MRRTTFIRRCTTGLMALALLATLPGRAPAAERTLKIGQNDALTGGGAVYGLPQHKAVKLAIAQINGAGGIKVGADTVKLDLVAYDDKANPTEATSSVRKLIDRDQVKFLVGFCCSGPTSAVASFIGNEDVVMIVGTAAERSITARGNPNVFRTRPPADFTGGAAGAFIATQGVKSLAVIGQLKDAVYQQYYARLKEEFTRRGGTIVAEETFAIGDRDMYPQLTKIKGLNPDAIFVGGYVEQSAFVYRQAIELGFRGKRFGFSGGNEQQFLKVVTSEQMEGVYDLRPVELTVEALGPTARKFVEDYTKMHGEAPTPNAPYAYDAVWALKRGLERAGTTEDVKKVLAAIRELTPPAEAVLKYLTIGGRMFDENGQAYTSNIGVQWRGGKWTYVVDLESDPAGYSKFLRSLRK